MKQYIENTPILLVQNISNKYGDAPLLQNVSFGLEAGEILCLLGPSGSGKTTLLRLIAGLEPDYIGQINFKGDNIQSIPPHKRGFGLMFQEYALFPHKNVHENIGFGLEMQKWGVDKQRRQVEKMLDLVGLTSLRNRRIDELSGGEKQRVALARSLAPEPKLLLLDEPLGSLDRTLRERLTIEIRHILKDLGVTAIFVTHDQNEAFGVADKIGILKNGVLQQFASPEELYRSPTNSNVANFLGFTNLFEVSIEHNTHMVGSPFGSFQYKPTSGNSLTNPLLLLRPEGAKIVDPANNIDPARLKIQGIVKSKRYQGSSYNLGIESKGHVLYFDLSLEPPPPIVGAQVQLVIDPAAMVLVENN